MSLEFNMITVIRIMIENIVSKGYMPTTLIVSKDIERKMFLDESFPKGDNYEDAITVDKYELHFIVINNEVPYINVLTDLQPIQ